MKEPKIIIPMNEVWELLNKPRRFFNALFNEVNKCKDEEIEEYKEELLVEISNIERFGKSGFRTRKECKRNVTEVLKFLDSHYLNLEDGAEKKIMLAVSEEIDNVYSDNLRED